MKYKRVNKPIKHFRALAFNFRATTTFKNRDPFQENLEEEEEGKRVLTLGDNDESDFKFGSFDYWD